MTKTPATGRRGKALHVLIVKAVRQGWTVTRTGSNHLRWRSPAGALVFSSSTPKNGRVADHLSQLRKAGFKDE